MTKAKALDLFRRYIGCKTDEEECENHLDCSTCKYRKDTDEIVAAMRYMIDWFE